MTRPNLSAVLLLTIATIPACSDGSADEEAGGPSHDQPTAQSAAPTNRVDINASVRQNLGVTFAKVESRNVVRTLRVPGRFELVPTARREYRVPAAGKVELLVRQYQTVEAGTPLYRLDSPRWRELQSQLNDAEAQVRLAQAAADSIGPFMQAHEKHHDEIQKAVDLWTARVDVLTNLQASGAVRAEDLAQAQASMTAARAELAETLEKEAELTARGRDATAQLDAAMSRIAILVQAAASLTGRPASELTGLAGERPLWRTLGEIEVRALTPGVVEALHANSGAFVDENAPVVVTVQPEQVRFRAHGLQSDLGKLTPGGTASVVSPQGGSLATAAPVVGTLTVAPTADPERRTIELIMTPSDGAGQAPPWARAGVSAFLEVIVSGKGGDALAIPLACVARDGTQSIIFRRDRSDPNKAVRMEADLGVDDGRWIVIKSGVAEADEIVLDGVYQLMVATSGSITKGGHFHPDGTFHEGDE